jgi:hypothetical protein
MAKNTAAAVDDALPVARIELKPLEEVVAEFPIIGVTPVIPHRWSEKAIAMMEQKQQGGALRARRQPKNPEEEAYQSCYWLGDSPAIPATAFKAAMVGGARFFEGLTMTQAKQLFYVEGEGPDQLVAIEGVASTRCDQPRNSGGTADLRYRYQISDWKTTLRIHFVPSMISASSIAALLDAGGRGGIGDWRPSAPKSATGTFGQFRVVT